MIDDCASIKIMFDNGIYVYFIKSYYQKYFTLIKYSATSNFLPHINNSSYDASSNKEYD